jgi:3-hydroxyisobutyrate dehydrogenase-like beta-hydroxyacid dehydrogenase
VATTVAILSPGDMGSAVGAVLAGLGHRVVTCLDGRSARTRGLAAAAGFADLSPLSAMVAEADLVLSILPPAAAVDTARRVAAAMAAAGATPVYADCNAIAPATAREAGGAIAAVGAPFVDCGIVGPAPRKAPATRFYVSGPDCAPMHVLRSELIEVREIAAEVGRASALKMCYAALTKGSWTLHAALLTAAARLGVAGPLHAEFEYSQKDAYARMRARIPSLPVDAGRWVGEMEEIAATFAAAGVTPDFHRGAAAMFRLLDRTPFAAETRETTDRDRTLEATIEALCKVIDAGG